MLDEHRHAKPYDPQLTFLHVSSCLGPGRYAFFSDKETMIEEMKDEVSPRGYEWNSEFDVWEEI